MTESDKDSNVDGFKPKSAYASESIESTEAKGTRDSKEPKDSRETKNSDDVKQFQKGQGSTPQTRRKRKIAMLILGSIFLLIGLIWLIYYLIWGQFEVYTDDAYVNGNMIQIMPQVAGTVVEIDSDDTQLVQQGQALVKLDPSDTEIALQHAQAALAQTVRQVKQTFENAQRAQETLILRNADLMKAQIDLKRRIGLVGERAISREEMLRYQTTASVAQAQYNAALHNMRSLLALVENSHIYTHPLVERAKANLRTAYLNRQRTTILAPVTGFVAQRTVQLGQQVSMSTPMLSIVPLTEVWVDANYKESQLNYLRIGQPVTLYADAYPDVTYLGKVVGLNAGTGAAFALLPPQNATGNWIKIVQRLPVRIGLDVKQLKKHPLQLGLSMRVTTNIQNIKGNRLSQSPMKQPAYVTDVYEQQLAMSDELIDMILQQNAPDSFIPRAGKSA
jgi:membrane fusion protein (multidrug efflux system)